MQFSLKKIRSALAVTAALIGLSVSVPASATGLLILEGSDAQTFHRLNPYSTDFLNGLASFSTASSLPIAIVNSSPVGAPTVGSSFLGSLSSGSTGLPTLSTMLLDYSALYIASPGTCCSESPLSTADAATVAGFLSAGRSVAIEDYQGGSQFDSIVGLTGALAGTGNSHVAGSGGGYPGLGSCFDGNIVAPGGAAYGLGPVGSAVPNLGCFGHQAYQASFFDPLGFTTYIVTTPPGALPGFHVVISNGGGAGCGLACVVTPAPEPSAFAVYGVGVGSLALIPAIGSVRRRRRNRTIERT